jgi:hypothetical protein
MVGVTPNDVPNTSGNPATTPGWLNGDPGWANEIQLGYRQQNGQIWYLSNGVYLGDGWVLTAYHVGVPARIQFDSGTAFDTIPNQNYLINNPPANQCGICSDSRLTISTPDLRLIRINGDPALTDSTIKSIVPPTPQQQFTISSQPLNLNDQVVIMGWGQLRSPTLSYFSVNKSTSPWTWTTVTSCSGPNCYSGYYSNGAGKAWGTNRIASSDSVLGENDGNLQTIVSNSTISYVTTYDQNSSDPFEALGVGGDSGSGVFFKRNGQWQLAGIVNAKYNYSGQSPQFDSSNTLAVFGNANAFVDLATYNSPSGSKIMEVINAHQDYSLVADIDLDGVAGTAADVAAFVAGWHYNNGAGMGTITSWKNGDIGGPLGVRDGITDVHDFLRMRTGLSAGAGAELGALLGLAVSGGIPEPSAIMLVMVPTIFFAMRGRRRRRK